MDSGGAQRPTAGEEQPTAPRGPIDFELLELLVERGRCTDDTIAAALDRDLATVRDRLAALTEAGFVSRVGSRAETDRYEVTDRGAIAYTYREASGVPGIDFAALVEDALPASPEAVRGAVSE